MSLIYRVLWYLLLPLGVIWHLIFIWRRPEYRLGFWQRYGWVPRHAQHPLLVHAASVGELNAVAEMLLQLAARDIPILVTTTTATGRDRFQQLFTDTAAIRHCYMPFDLGLAQRLLLQRVKPRAILLVETELWPNLLRLSASKSVPVWLVNGRLSQRSARRYRRFKGLTQSMLDNLQRLLVQDQASARRFAHIGATKSRIQVMGSVKFDLVLPISTQSNQHSQWLRPDEPCWVCGSTREGEEATLLQAWAKMSALPQGLMVLVPRHPQRFEEVADICAQSGLPWCRLSHGIDQGFMQHQGRRVLLVDAMGLLIDFYRMANVVFVGGSLVDKGGHNPLEAAALGKPVLMGLHTYNFATVCELLEKVGNLRLVSAADLVEQVPALLSDPPAQLSMGQAGEQVVAQQRGATLAYITLLEQEFGA
ncbi:MAG: 3-deoxy-D-manno-octulosonic acid transferase [Gammaproteobacteria bacterium]|nr:3-deoxy-D-manno-octulosonic acid transferase [Gammaproteobacteria bacterium]